MRLGLGRRIVRGLFIASIRLRWWLRLGFGLGLFGFGLGGLGLFGFGFGFGLFGFGLGGFGLFGFGLGLWFGFGLGLWFGGFGLRGRRLLNRLDA